MLDHCSGLMIFALTIFSRYKILFKQIVSADRLRLRVPSTLPVWKQCWGAIFGSEQTICNIGYISRPFTIHPLNLFAMYMWN